MKTVLHITRGILHDHASRRWAMFLLTLAAVVVLFSGATLLSGFLATRPVWFLVYWGLCAWLTLVVLLLAIFDMLIVRAQARTATRRLRKDVFGKEEKRR
jgi:hypothetical protein